MSWRPLPRTTRCSDRTRERRTARTMQVSRATIATAPAAIATMPTVLVNWCTEGRIGPVSEGRRRPGAQGPGRARARDRPADPAARQCRARPRSTGYWKVIVNDWELRRTLFSPGTRSIWATTVWVPVGGAALSFTLQVDVWPGLSWGTIAWPATPVPLTVTLQTMLVSWFCPVLVKFRVNVGGGLAGSVAVPPGVRVVPLTLTELSLWP